MSDPNNDVKTALLAEVNRRHGLALTPQTAVFGAPLLLDGTVLDFTNPTARNSRVEVTAGDTIKVDVNYNRLDLTKIFNLRSTEFADTEQTSAHGLLAALSERLRTTITANDIEDTAINRSGSTPTVTVQAKTNSLKLIGQINLTLKAGDTPPEPVRANRMLFANSTVAKLTNDLVTYEDITGSFAPVVTGDKTALMAGLADGFLMALQGDYFNENVTMNYRPGEDAPWAVATWPGRLWSTYMTVFNNEAYFAMSEPEIDPWGNTCGLYRIIFNVNEDGGYTPAYERVLDLWVNGTGMDIQMAVDPVTNLFVVASGLLHYTSNGVDWTRYELPRLYSGNDRSEMPRIVGLGLYDNELRVLSGTISGGSGWTGDKLEYLSGPVNFLDQTGYQIHDWTFGPHGQYQQIEYGDKVSFYYGSEGMFMGMGSVDVRDENGSVESEMDIGQIWKYNESQQKWVKVIHNTGIINGLFIKLGASLIWAGGNRDNLGGMENLVVSYDDGETWAADPSNPNSPFKLDPTKPSSITAVNLDAWNGPEPTYLNPPTINVEQTWPDSMPYYGFSRAVDIGGDYLISAGNKLLYVESDGTVDESWSSDYIGSAPSVWALADGGYFIAGDASKWKGQDTGYVRYARITSAGAVDTTFVEPVTQSTYAGQPSLTKLRNGGWLAWGTLIRWNDEEVDFIVKLNEDFTRDPTFAVNFDTYNTYMGVTSVAELPDGTILLTAGHHPDRTSRTAWYFINPATGAEIANYGLDLGTGLRDPQSGEYPIIADAFTDPDTGTFWIFTKQRNLPNGAWGVRFDPTSKQVLTSLTEGNCMGGGLLGTVTFNGRTQIYNATSYRGLTAWAVKQFEPSFIEFFTRDGELIEPADKPFNIQPHDNSGGTASLRLCKLSGEDYLLYGNFGYVEQNPYPRFNRVKSRNLCKIRVASGLA
ncbi:hypothetical protein [Xanthomonas phage RTH11]|nr:hypothetical protein [Xanthomonas phage RTH11]